MVKPFFIYLFFYILVKHLMRCALGKQHKLMIVLVASRRSRCSWRRCRTKARRSHLQTLLPDPPGSNSPSKSPTQALLLAAWTPLDAMVLREHSLRRCEQPPSEHEPRRPSPSEMSLTDHHLHFSQNACETICSDKRLTTAACRLHYGGRPPGDCGATTDKPVDALAASHLFTRAVIRYARFRRGLVPHQGVCLLCVPAACW